MSEAGRVWNYRVLKQTSPSYEEDWFEIVEVHYDKPDGKPIAYSDGRSVLSDTAEGLKWVLQKHAEALDKPILTLEDFPKPRAKGE